MMEQGSVPNGANLTRYHTIKHELFDQLTDQERRAYETKAAERNEAYKTRPDALEIFK